MIFKLYVQIQVLIVFLVHIQKESRVSLDQDGMTFRLKKEVDASIAPCSPAC
jgi:hypothetical protein